MAIDPGAEFLVEVTLRVDAAGTERTWYWSTHGRTTGPAETPANTVYYPRIVQPGALQVDLFRKGATGGQSRYGYGVVILANTDGGLDELIDYGFAGQPISILMGEVGAARATFTEIFRGTLEQPVWEWGRLPLRIRDRQYDLARAVVQTSTYAGTNTGSPLAGIEGGDDLKGVRKPLVYGKVSNVSPRHVNTDRYIFQASDVALQSVDAVYDNGLALTAGAAYSSQSDMETNAPSAGAYRAWVAGGCVRVGTKPTGEITVDVSQGATAAARTCGQVLQALALRAGLSAAEISSPDVAALDAACAYELGVYVDDSRSPTAIMDDVAGSIGAWYGFDAAGVLRMGRIVAPSGTPAAELDASNVLSVSRLASTDAGASVPAWRVTLTYWPNGTQQRAALNASVTAARRAYVVREHLSVVAEDSTVQLQHPLAVELAFDTLLVSGTDAAAEATRRLELYKVRRDRLRVRVPMTTDLRSVAPGDVVQLSLDRYDLATGRLFLVTGMTTDFARRSIDFDLWG